jgi:hypothetical protein
MRPETTQLASRRATSESQLTVCCRDREHPNAKASGIANGSLRGLAAVLEVAVSARRWRVTAIAVAMQRSSKQAPST